MPRAGTPVAHRAPRFAVTALACAASVATALAPASAAMRHRIGTFRLPQPKAPVAITQCIADMAYNPQGFSYDSAGIDYRNRSSKRVTSVTASFYIVDHDHHVVPSQHFDGSFTRDLAPGATRVTTVVGEGRYATPFMIVAGGLVNQSPTIGILCTVQKVAFADGSTWTAPLADSLADHPGPYVRYPTPNY